MPPETQIKIIERPVRTLSLGMIADWERSAAARASVARDAEQDLGPYWRDEVRAFLPRIMELMSLGEEPSGLGVENSLRVAALADWPQWPKPERDIIVRFAEAFFVAHLQNVTFAFCKGKGHILSLQTQARDVVVALLILGISPDRIIELWWQAPDPAAALHLADTREGLTYDWGAEHHVLNSVWLDDEVPQIRLGQWLAGADVAARLEANFFAITAEDHDGRAMREVLSRGLG